MDGCSLASCLPSAGPTSLPAAPPALPAKQVTGAEVAADNKFIKEVWSVWG